MNKQEFMAQLALNINCAESNVGVSVMVYNAGKAKEVIDYIKAISDFIYPE